MSHIFISYSRKDLDIAERIVSELAKNNFNTWIDWKSIPKGEEFINKIYQGIEAADVFLFLISPDSVESNWCKAEIKHATENNKRIIPILIRETKNDSIPSEIAKRNWIFCRDKNDNFDVAIKETLETISADYEWVEYHTNLQIKALEWEERKENSGLLRRNILREAEEKLAIAGQKDPQPTDLQRQYILESRKAENRNRNSILIAAGVAITALIFISIFAFNQRNLAVNNEATARANLIVAQTAQADAEIQKATAIANEQFAKEQANIALARLLAIESQSIIPTNLSEQNIKLLLAIQSMQLFPTFETSQLLREDTLPYLVASLEHNDDPVNAIDFSADGRYIVSGGVYGNVRVWEAETGRLIAHMRHNNTTGDKRVSSVAFSPNGQYIVSGSWDGTARVWEISTRNEISRVTNGDYILSVAFSPNGKYVVSGGCDKASGGGCANGSAHVWEAITGKEIALITHNDRVVSVAFSPNGQYIVSGSYDDTAKIWDIETDREIAQIAHSYDVNFVAFSPDGNYIVTGSGDGTACVWETLNGNRSKCVKHNSSVNAVKFSPDGKYILSGSDDHTARVWEVSTGKEIARITHDNRVVSVAFSPNGQYVVSGSWDSTARVWEPTTGTEVSRMTHVYRDDLFSWAEFVMFSPDGKYVASASYNGTVQVWKTNPEEVFRLSHSGPFAFSPNGQYIIVGGKGNTAQIWDITTGEEISHMNFDNWVNSVSFSYDGKYAIASGGPDIRIWEIMTGKEIMHVTQGYLVSHAFFSPDDKIIVYSQCDQQSFENLTKRCLKGYTHIWDVASEREVALINTNDLVTAVEISPDGAYLALGDWSGTFVIWNIKLGIEVVRKVYDRTISSLVFSKNGEYLISGSRDGTAKVWDTASGVDISQLIHDRFFFSDGTYTSDDVRIVVFSPDEKNIITGTYEGVIRVWETVSGIEKYRMRHDKLGLQEIAVSPDGKYVASGSGDDTARVWDLSTGKEVARTTYSDWVSYIAFSPNGKYVASGSSGLSYDNGISIWMFQPIDLVMLACSQVTRNLTREEWKEHIGDALPYQAVCQNLPVESETIPPP